MDDLTFVRRMWAEDRASQALGMELETLALGHAVVRMAVTADMVNGHGICHGGYVFTLADSAFALACNGHGTMTVATGADVNFLASAKEGDVLVAEATVLAEQGRSGLTDVRVSRGVGGQVIAQFRGRSRQIGRAQLDTEH